MDGQHFISALPTWVECYHKENKRKVFQARQTYRDVDNYKFLIYRNEKYESSDAFVAGYFRYKENKFFTDKALFKTNGITIDEVCINAVEEYNRLKSAGYFVSTESLEIERWTEHSPFD